MEHVDYMPKRVCQPKKIINNSSIYLSGIYGSRIFFYEVTMQAQKKAIHIFIYPYHYSDGHI